MPRTLAFLAALLTAGAAHAQTPDQSPDKAPAPSPAAVVAHEILPAFDLNRDGRIARGEFDRGLDKAFRSWDRDGDSYLLPMELPSPALARIADANNDQLVEYSEYLTPMLRLRDRLDRNGDRVVTAREWNDFLRQAGVLPPPDAKDGRPRR